MIFGKGDLPLTVVTLRAGDKYGPEYVSRLHSAVTRNLTVPHRFVCMTDQPDQVDCETVAIPMNLQGWWGKVALFSGFLPGRLLFFDLDTVIVGNIDEFARYTGKLAVIRPFYRPQGIASGVMGIAPGTNRHVWKTFNRDVDQAIQFCRDNADPGWNWGDQRWLELNVEQVEYWQDLLPGQLVSYKVHCEQGLPKNARIVCFHGDPNPHEVSDSWMLEYWK